MTSPSNLILDRVIPIAAVMWLAAAGPMPAHVAPAPGNSVESAWRSGSIFSLGPTEPIVRRELGLQR